jgi:multiple sugar transport system permease protein
LSDTTQTARSASTIRRPRVQISASKIAARVILYALTALFLLPIYSMVTSGLKTPQELGQFPPTLFPQQLAWDNFFEATTFIPFWHYFGNTVFVTVLSTIGSVGSSFIIAYGFARFSFPGRNLLFYTVLGSIFLASFPVVTLIPLFDLFTRLGWVNTYLPLIVPTFFGNAFYIFLLRQFLVRLPNELLEAARLDGANEFQLMREIVVPLALPAIAVVSIFAVFAAWNDFLNPLIYLQDQSKYTLAIGLTFYKSMYESQWHLMNMASTLVVLPEIIIFLLFQRAFLRGIAAGAIK